MSLLGVIPGARELWAWLRDSPVPPASRPASRLPLGLGAPAWLGSWPSLADAGSHFSRDLTRLAAVLDWSEPLLGALVGTHLVLLSALLWVRNDATALTRLFGLLTALALMSGPLNHLGHKHWARIASKNYFDEPGFFVSVTWGFPLVGQLLIGMVLLLRLVAKSLIQVKRRQFAVERKRKQAQAAGQNLGQDTKSHINANESRHG